MLHASRACRYLNECYLTKYVLHFSNKKMVRKSEMPVLGSICCDMFAAIFNLCNKNLILFVINSIILKAFRKLYSTQQIMLVSSL